MTIEVGPRCWLEDTLHHAGLGPLYEKVQADERLRFQDGVRLYDTPDLNALGLLANLVRERLHGDVTYFVRNQHINYTNVCNKGCLFCSFDVLPKDPAAYVLSPQEVRDRIQRYQDIPIREIHIVGGVNPRLPYSYYLDLVRTVREVRPQVVIKAFTMIEIEQIARVGKRTVEEALLDLKQVGLDMLPGGGAEVFSERVHADLFRAKSDSERWIDIARTAHRLGLPSNATMLYGHVEERDEKVEHLLRLRELQEETAGIQCYIPLSWHPEGTELEHLSGPTGMDDLREVAVGRLLLDNVPHVKSFWIMNSPPITQIAQWYGADDADGTIQEYEIVRDPRTDRRQVLTEAQLLRMIREAGRSPVERDGRYRVVQVWDSGVKRGA